MLVQLGITVAQPAAEPQDDGGYDDFWADAVERPPTFPEMLKLAFDAKLPSPEPVVVQPKWIAGGAFELDCEFFKFVGNRNLVKQEGLILRHLLRLAVLAGEFVQRTQDPDYQRIGELATKTCKRVDESYTDRFLSQAAEFRKAAAG
jgi:hypothetical protein